MIKRPENLRGNAPSPTSIQSTLFLNPSNSTGLIFGLRATFLWDRKEAETAIFITLDVKRPALYNPGVIRTFKDKETQKVFHRQFSRKLPPSIQQVTLRKLRMINNAYNLTDLRIPPANHLEKLTDNRSGEYSIRINDQWRICFEWRGNTAYNVEITDYH